MYIYIYIYVYIYESERGREREGKIYIERALIFKPGLFIFYLKFLGCIFKDSGLHEDKLI